MPQELLREKLVGRIYGIRKDFEDGLLLCETISAMSCFSRLRLTFFFFFFPLLDIFVFLFLRS